VNDPATLDDLLGPELLLEAARAIHTISELGLRPEDVPRSDWQRLAPDAGAVEVARRTLHAVYRYATHAHHPAGEEVTLDLEHDLIDELAARRHLRATGRR